MIEFTVTFIALSIGGILNSGYLVYEHYKKRPLVCPLDHDCSVVTESKWSNVFGVRNEILGLLFYVGIFGAIVFSLFSPNLISTIHFLLIIGTGTGVLFSIFLTLVQIFAIKDYCFYCIISAILTFLLFINSFFL